MVSKSIFLASSSELKKDRLEFESFVSRKNNDWVDKGIFLKLFIWEDFLDAMSQTRLQDEYNKAVRIADIFVMLFRSKVGRYTEEEFDTAFHQFKATHKPFIFTYFKRFENRTSRVNKSDLASLHAFQQKLRRLGHFQTVYNNVNELKLHFGQQLDKLAKSGFIKFSRDTEAASARARLRSSGDAQRPKAVPINAAIERSKIRSTQIEKRTIVNTGGGAYIRGYVEVNGDFVGRDKREHRK